MLGERCAGKLDEDATRYFGFICRETRRLSQLVADLLKMAQLATIDSRHESVNISSIAHELANSLQASDSSRKGHFRIQDGIMVLGHTDLLRVVLENLLSNAWKYTSRQDRFLIEFGEQEQPHGTRACFVRDNGAGFDMQYVHKLFTPFQRLHTQDEFTGTGLGLATVQRIIARHGGRIWAEAQVDRGASFFFTLPG